MIVRMEKGSASEVHSLREGPPTDDDHAVLRETPFRPNLGPVFAPTQQRASCGSRLDHVCPPFETPTPLQRRLGAGLLQIARAENAEYIDLLSTGIAPSALTKSGFLNRRDYPDWIVPNYFEPFLAKNAAVRWAAKTPANFRYIAFKGDGDQDRPNLSIARS